MEEGRTGAADGRAIRRSSRVRARNGPASSSTTSVSAQQHPRDDRPNGDDVDARLPSRGTVRPADASIDAGCTVDRPVRSQPAGEALARATGFIKKSTTNRRPPKNTRRLTVRRRRRKDAPTKRIDPPGHAGAASGGFGEEEGVLTVAVKRRALARMRRAWRRWHWW